MIIGLTSSASKRRKRETAKRRWHRRTIFMRVITIGGHGTDEPSERVFIFFGTLWARRSETLQRWLYAVSEPRKPRPPAPTNHN